MCGHVIRTIYIHTYIYILTEYILIQSYHTLVTNFNHNLLLFIRSMNVSTEEEYNNQSDINAGNGTTIKGEVSFL